MKKSEVNFVADVASIQDSLEGVEEAIKGLSVVMNKVLIELSTSNQIKKSHFDIIKTKQSGSVPYFHNSSIR